jgi:hypothetical protein
MKRRTVLASGLAAAFATACGGGTDATKAQVRLVNASAGYSALDLTVDDGRRQSSVAYGQTASYAEVDPDHTETVVSQSNSAGALVSLTPSLAKEDHYSLLAYGNEGGLAVLVLDENADEPASGKTQLRVVNAAPDAGDLDVYVTAVGDPLSAAVAVVSAAGVGDIGSYVTLNSGTRQLRITAAALKDDLRLDVSNLVLPGQRNVTLVLTPGRGGMLVNALLLQDRGGITQLANTQARVRLAAGAAGGAAVTASVGSTTLATNVAAPAITDYALVSAGTVTVAAAVAGSAASLTSATLAAGGDYTLLAYGSSAAPQASLIEDDNHLPTVSTKAKVRVLHGISDVSEALTLKVALTQIGSTAAQGAASTYGLVDPSTTATIVVNAAGDTDNLFPTTAQTFVAGAVYTVFMLGGSSALGTALKQDR